ncbi:hypothetical protein V5F49_11140 [Xanthobacter sp. V3C-3]|uniref:hypothetical protein n=1 Tax=Xanthobacter lutulentifluminis TaxID=3119935 RepID=UPI003726D883
MIPAAEDPAARAWRAGIRLDYELGRAGALVSPLSLRAQLLGSSSHFAVILAGAQWGRRP